MKTPTFDRHGDVITENELPEGVRAELAEFRDAVRKDPRFSRLLAVSLPRAAKLLIFVGLVLGGCAADEYDPHALGTCIIPDAGGGGMPSPELSCEDACADVTFADVNAGTSCESSAFDAVSGTPHECQAITAADGTRGCCKLVASNQDPRLRGLPGQLSTGWEFFKCDDQGGK